MNVPDAVREESERLSGVPDGARSRRLLQEEPAARRRAPHDARPATQMAPQARGQSPPSSSSLTQDVQYSPDKDKLGEGAFGEVYKGRLDIGALRRVNVAIKVPSLVEGRL